MDDTDAPDPLLQQVPLLKNPAFQPPKPITLNTNYAKLIPNLRATVIPPKLNISEQDIESWIADLEKVKAEKLNPDIHKEAQQQYHDWLKGVQRKVAPGFSYDIMTPTSAERKIEEGVKEVSVEDAKRESMEASRSELNEDLRTLSMN